MSTEIRAPWTPEQVAALNRFQQRGRMHPFTCGNLHADSQSPVLTATPDGWRCPTPGCGYEQDWAPDFMASVSPASGVQPECGECGDTGACNGGPCALRTDTRPAPDTERDAVWAQAFADDAMKPRADRQGLIRVGQAVADEEQQEMADGAVRFTAAIRRQNELLRAEVESANETTVRAREQRQEMAEERYAWQERGDRAEALAARLRAELEQARAATLVEAADEAEKLRQFEKVTGARWSAQVSENVGILRVVDHLRAMADARSGGQGEVRPPSTAWHVEYKTGDTWHHLGIYPKEQADFMVTDLATKDMETRLIRATTTYTVEPTGQDQTPDCERCDGTGLDPDRFTDQQDPNGGIRFQHEPCTDCHGTGGQAEDGAPTREQRECGSTTPHRTHLFLRMEVVFRCPGTANEDGAPVEPTAAVLLSTPCDACRHTLNWHDNQAGCTVARCVCGRWQA
ncbi:hypothetical protein ACFVTT_35385, partial [Streptomyces niveus]